MGYRIINGNFYPVGDFPQGNSRPQQSVSKKSDVFENILKDKMNTKADFTISNHAAKRLQDRNIEFNEIDMNNINKGINIASEKGSKDSLIIYKDVALVASVKNRTIITAIDKNENKENVFTNIDSVVML